MIRSQAGIDADCVRGSASEADGAAAPARLTLFRTEVRTCFWARGRPVPAVRHDAPHPGPVRSVRAGRTIETSYDPDTVGQVSRDGLTAFARVSLDAQTEEIPGRAWKPASGRSGIPSPGSAHSRAPLPRHRPELPRALPGRRPPCLRLSLEIIVGRDPGFYLFDLRRVASGLLDWDLWFWDNVDLLCTPNSPGGP
jgi:hypothetical protein